MRVRKAGFDARTRGLAQTGSQGGVREQAFEALDMGTDIFGASHDPRFAIDVDLGESAGVGTQEWDARGHRLERRVRTVLPERGQDEDVGLVQAGPYSRQIETTKKVVATFECE